VSKKKKIEEKENGRLSINSNSKKENRKGKEAGMIQN